MKPATLATYAGLGLVLLLALYQPTPDLQARDLPDLQRPAYTQLSLPDEDQAASTQSEQDTSTQPESQSDSNTDAQAQPEPGTSVQAQPQSDSQTDSQSVPESLTLSLLQPLLPQKGVLSFSADWCKNCTQAKANVTDKLRAAGWNVLEYDVDQHPELCAELGVESIPCFIPVKGGQITDEKYLGTSLAPVLAFFGQKPIYSTGQSTSGNSSSNLSTSGCFCSGLCTCGCQSGQPCRCQTYRSHKAQTGNTTSPQSGSIRSIISSYRGPSWYVRGTNLRSHLMREHGFSSAQLFGLSHNELLRLHGYAHENNVQRGYISQPVRTTYRQPSSMRPAYSRSGSGCPSGNCPVRARRFR